MQYVRSGDRGIDHDEPTRVDLRGRCNARPRSERARRNLRSHSEGRARHRPVGWPRCHPRRGDCRRQDCGRRGQHRGRCNRDCRCAWQDRCAWLDRHSHACRPQQGRAGAAPARWGDRLGRCRLSRRRQYRSDRRGSARRSPNRPRARQYRTHRRCLSRWRAARHEPGQCGLGARGDRPPSRYRRRRQGAPVGKRGRRQRS
jgi:hypothetical protein